MSLTLPDVYTSNARVNAGREEWIVRLYYDNEGASDYIGLAFKDLIIDNVQYHPVILDMDDLVHKIDLKKQTSSIQNIEITVSDKYKSGLLSDELFMGTRVYLNHQVTIYSILVINTVPTASSSGFCLYTGKLRGIKDFDNGQFTLQIEQEPLGKGIMIPNTKSSNSIYYPVAYGDFQLPDSASVYDYKRVYPCPQDTGNTKQFNGYPWLFYLTTNSVTSDYAAFYHIPNDGFGKVHDSVGISGGNMLEVATPFNSKIIIRPTVENADYAYNGDFSNPENVYDFWDDSVFDTSYAEYTDTISGNPDSWNTGLYMDLPASDRRLIACKVYYRISLTISNLTWNAGEDPSIDTSVTVRDNTEDSAVIIGYWDPTDGEGTWNSWASTSIWVDDSLGVDSEYVEADDMDTSTFDYKMPAYNELYFTFYSRGASTTYDVSIKVYDLYVEAEFDEEYLDEDTKQKAIEKLKNIFHVYCGEDGLTQSYTGGSGIASLPHEIHRDLLARYTEFDVAGGSLDGWTAINTNRSTWECCWWQLEPKDLIDILNQLQFEGCFIFYQKPNGGGRYICLEDDYSSGDFVFTDDDFINLNISTSPLDDLETKFILNYHKHPNPEMARYLKTRTVTYSTERTEFNIGTNENIITYNFEFLNADILYESALTDPNDCFASYRYKLFSYIKVMVNFELINRAYWGIECGDIFQISSTIYDVFNSTWGDLWFMVISIKRNTERIEVAGYLVQNDG